MLNERLLPRLTLPDLTQGTSATTVDLRVLLYRSGSTLNRKEFSKALELGKAGDFFPERVELVEKIHSFIEGKLVAGESPETAENRVHRTIRFFSWATEAGLPLTVNSLTETYLQWAQHLFQRYKVIKDLSQAGSYASASVVGSIIDVLLGRSRSIITLTRLKRPRERKTPQGRLAERQNLTDTFTFGHLLQDICDGLTLEVIKQRRILIPLRGGGVFKPWTGSRKNGPTEIIPQSEVIDIQNQEQASDRGSFNEPRGRQSVINIRITAELLIFIAQTGINLTPANNLKMRQFSYESDIDGYRVKNYKARRQGETLFEIYKDYRSHFERYLQWRAHLFPGSALLFPFIKESAHETKPPTLEVLRRVCREANVPWIAPRTLRATRVNWMLRRSSDPDLTAELAQHSKKTLIQIYEVPSAHRTVAEVGRFWLSGDPTLSIANAADSIAPGRCDGRPVESASKPAEAPSPDCLRASGCLWCEHHRDIDTQEYVWAVASFRYLKTLEATRHMAPSEEQELRIPAQHVINRLNEILAWFKGSNLRRKKFVEVALSRVEGGHYHPDWSYLILATAGQTQ